METLKKMTAGFEMLSKLPGRERRWVATELVRAANLQASVGDFVRRVEPMAASAKRPSVFLSHSHTDKPFVRALATKLERYGIRVWLDEAELHVGDSLIAKLSQVIKEIDIVVAVMSRASVASAWVLEELQWAMTHQIEGKTTKVLTVVKEPCDRPPFLDGRLFADFSTPYRREQGLAPLVSSIYHQSQRKRA
jgi:TIR domain